MKIENENLVLGEDFAALPDRQWPPEKVFGFGDTHPNPVDGNITFVTANLVATDANNTFDQGYIRRQITPCFDQLADAFRRVHQHEIAQPWRCAIEPKEANP